ncbi:preprotein translocase subunit SecG [Mycoplasma tauri]|uniref:Protein-export membrane protein SecG n=1 Tax=Mycoplasma tauri TaxID=547987 RepID=A0A953NG57_9MOLU|nr:preprotein translocase subunit SecG [Mycoplasma tauri]MBZ4195265.1 preprotein translocase subunit SecG [Mycoplasma tauri]MBZ4203840.1 preprotein translocase subunit SecG [Mycoplasma tauri]MBZ4204172.1 preprotein translocase subunit SecG [Mycoplasma tauri]MBZ4212570.1 preprotein translocase subunit SecG [Mycoplasma tauri]MBZ4218202.1 preprotein translocase subunit SecG [Mycoplasma tauri]
MEPKAIISIFLAIISIIAIIVSLLMSPDSNGFSGALVGSGDLELFKTSKERGFKKVLKWLMIACGLLLMLLSIICWAVK